MRPTTGAINSSTFAARHQVVDGVCAGRQDQEPPDYVQDFVDRTVPGYSETEFRQHFRLALHSERCSTSYSVVLCCYGLYSLYRCQNPTLAVTRWISGSAFVGFAEEDLDH